MQTKRGPFKLLCIAGEQVHPCKAAFSPAAMLVCMNLPVRATISTAAAKLPWSCSAGLQDLGSLRGLISRSQARLYCILLCFWFLFLAFVHAMKNKIKEKLKIWLYLQVSFKPDSSTNKKLKFKFQSLF